MEGRGEEIKMRRSSHALKLFSYKFHCSNPLELGFKIFSLIEIFLTESIQWLFFYIHLSHGKSSAAKNPEAITSSLYL